jgi:hypothetical protein
MVKIYFDACFYGMPDLDRGDACWINSHVI